MAGKIRRCDVCSRLRVLYQRCPHCGRGACCRCFNDALGVCVVCAEYYVRWFEGTEAAGYEGD